VCIYNDDEMGHGRTKFFVKFTFCYHSCSTIRCMPRSFSSTSNVLSKRFSGRRDCFFRLSGETLKKYVAVRVPIIIPFNYSYFTGLYRKSTPLTVINIYEFRRPRRIDRRSRRRIFASSVFFQNQTRIYIYIKKK